MLRFILDAGAASLKTPPMAAAKEAGLSHGGIYIGNNQFIHAENPSTGVRISDLNSNYYSSRWYGAVRL